MSECNYDCYKLKQAEQSAAITCASIIFNDSEWRSWKCECCEDYVCTTCRVKERFGLEI